MFPLHQNPTGSTLDTLGGFGLPATQLPPLGNFQSLQRLGAPTMPPGGMVDPALTQMVMMQQQMNQMLLGMMQMLMTLMLNREGGAQSTGRQMGHSGLGGGGGVSGSNGASGSLFNSSQTLGAGGPKVQKLIDAALSKQGTPYVFGAAGPDKFDCSGLVSWALKQAGSNIQRLTAEGLHKHYANASVSKEQLQPGDLVFFWSPNDRGIPKGQATHVEIYLGDGKTMGTDSPKEGAKVEPINWSTFIGGARPPELAG
ncbi:C40 family peptidase [bacterium]|nr:C40 family peptidase [bacterium]